jgi:hypothetical protein
MAHNRKSQWAGLRYGAVVKALLFCSIIGGLGLGYVWQQQQVYYLGEQIKKSELNRDKARRQNDNLRRSLADLESPRALDAMVRKLNLGLQPPSPEQVWRIPEEMTNFVVLPAQPATAVKVAQNGKKL